MGNLSKYVEKLRLLNSTETPVINQIESAFTNADLPIPGEIKIDGCLHRFKTGKKNKDGWYVFHHGEVVWGAFGCNRTMTDGQVNFVQDKGRALTGSELLSIERARAQAQERKTETIREAANEALKTWAKTEPAPPNHAYLQKKRLSRDNIRSYGDALIIPYFDELGNMRAYERILQDGTKLSQKGASRKNLYGIQGEPQAGQKAFITEGFSDAATVYQQAGVPCAFSGGTSNLANAVGALKKRWPQTDWEILADNDEKQQGETAAQKASEMYTIPWRIPCIPHKDISDAFNAGVDIRQELAPVSTAKSLAWDDILADTAPTRWLVKGWVPCGLPGMLHGPSGAGKSFLAADMAMAAATGKSHWQGCKVRKGSVLCLAGEGQRGFVRRLQAWAQENEPADKPSLRVYTGALDLDQPGGLNELVREIEALPEPPSLIQIDTLHCYFAGDENSPRDARAILNNLKLIIERYGCAIVLVHHTGLGEAAQTRARGSSAWRGALDFEINVSADRKVQHMKSKDGELMHDFYFELKQVPLKHRFDEDGEQETSAVIVAAEKPAAKEPTKETPQKRIEAAWWACGAQWKHDQPVIRKDQLREWLVNERGLTESSAAGALKPSMKTGMIRRLIDVGFVSVSTNNIVIQSPELQSKLRLKTGITNE